MTVVENKQKNHFTVITYTDQGLGHLRVSSALESSAPVGVSPILYSPDEEFATILHRISSSNVVMRRILLAIQFGWLERPYTWIYKQYLRLGIKGFEKKIDDLFTLSTVRLDKLVFVTTHFGLAHQLAIIKKSVFCNKKCKFVLIVVVTDDSPQRPWYVSEADMTVVPSDTTKKRLLEIAGKTEAEFRIEVNPYPISPLLSKRLNSKEFTNRINMTQNISEVIKVSLPISGAAVGTDFDLQLIKELNNSKYSFEFNIVGRDRSYVHNFIKNADLIENVNIFTSKEDLEIVEYYDRQFLDTNFLFEITKPSEQSFKALLNPKTVGGVLLLLKRPVGRQELDNINFLIRHFMIPDDAMQQMLFKKAQEGKPPSKTMLKNAKNWRGVRLPKSAKESSRFIQWGLRNGIFTQMVKGGNKPSSLDSHAHELGANGADKFWKLIDEYYEGEI